MCVCVSVFVSLCRCVFMCGCVHEGEGVCVVVSLFVVVGMSLGCL